MTLAADLPIPIVLAVAIPAVLLIAGLWFVSRRLFKIPANRVLVVKRDGNRLQCHHGGAVWVWPGQRHGWLELEPFRFVYPLPEPLGNYDLRVSAGIGTTPEALKRAAERWLDVPRGEVEAQAEATVAKAVRRTIDEAELAETNACLDALQETARAAISRSLDPIGMVPVNVTIPAPAAYEPTHRVAPQAPQEKEAP